MNIFATDPVKKFFAIVQNDIVNNIKFSVIDLVPHKLQSVEI